MAPRGIVVPSFFTFFLSILKELDSELSTWKTLNLVRSLGVIVGWALVSLRPGTDLLQKHLRRLAANTKRDQENRQTSNEVAQ